MQKLVKQLNKNFKGRDFVVGDLHGCFNQLSQLLAHVNFSTATDRLISVGDLIDRGPNSLDCLRLLQEPWFHAVIGNHEDMAIKTIVEGNSVWKGVWDNNGGKFFTRAASPTDIEALDEIEFLVKEFVANLPVLITVPMVDGRKFHVLHAELHSEVELTDAELDSDKIVRDVGISSESMDGPAILWGRSVFMTLMGKEPTEQTRERMKRDAMVHRFHDWMLTDMLSDIFVGHTPMKQPTKAWKMINIDTHGFANRVGTGITLAEPASGKFWTYMLQPDKSRIVQERELFVID